MPGSVEVDLIHLVTHHPYRSLLITRSLEKFPMVCEKELRERGLPTRRPRGHLSVHRCLDF